jgi:hypothetical protein
MENVLNLTKLPIKKYNVAAPTVDVLIFKGVSGESLHGVLFTFSKSV